MRMKVTECGASWLLRYKMALISMRADSLLINSLYLQSDLFLDKVIIG